MNQHNVGYLLRSLIQSLHSVNQDTSSTLEAKLQAQSILTSFLYEIQNTRMAQGLEVEKAWEAFHYPEVHPNKLAREKPEIDDEKEEERDYDDE